MVTVFDRKTIPLSFEEVASLFGVHNAVLNHSSAHYVIEKRIPEAYDDPIEQDDPESMCAYWEGSVAKDDPNTVSERWEIGGARFELQFNANPGTMAILFATPPGNRERMCGIYGLATSRPEGVTIPAFAMNIGTDGPVSSSFTTASGSANAKAAMINEISDLSRALKKTVLDTFSHLGNPLKMEPSAPLTACMRAKFEKTGSQTCISFEANLESKVLSTEQLSEFASNLIECTYKFSLK
jgi:hypothetical protein